MTALMGIPLILAAGYSLDMNRANKNSVMLSSALDSAALAAVIPAHLSDEAREAYAKEVFSKNFMGSAPVTLTVDATRERVSITGQLKTDSFIGGAIGQTGIDVRDTATAVLTQSDVVCVLALDPDAEDAIVFDSQASFSAPSCTVQVNSTHKKALVAKSHLPPLAKSFCAAGGSDGIFAPRVKNDCTLVADPYENLMPPDDGVCMDTSKLKGNNEVALSYDVMSAMTADSMSYDDPDFGLDIVGDNAVLYPGTYCKGLEIKGTNVNFMPGTYILKDKKLKFKSFASAYGRDVTFIMKTQKDALEIEGNSRVMLKAPKSGDYEGIVFYQTLIGAKTAKPKVDKKTGLPLPPKLSVSKIKTGGGLKIVGTAYLPNQLLEISSDSPVASRSPATSFIAARFLFTGNSHTEVNIDHVAGGIPPLQPRSDDGARLIE